MYKNKSLTQASKAKEDEFYTKLSDIEKELNHYREYFKNKTILCNCDDPYESNFFKYFAMNFNFLGIKKLIATCYSESFVSGEQLSLFDISVFNRRPSSKKQPYKIEITEVNDANNDGAISLVDVEYLIKNGKNVLTLLDDDGDFRSKECVELLKEADVVVTNPPFSLFREYVAQLMKYDKKFIIIGNQNAITYKEIFSYIKNNKIWTGYNSGDMEFLVPNYYEPRATRYREENGVKFRSMGNICWFTNVDIKKRHEDIILYKKYKSEEYPKYDNYDAINVNKVTDIPCNYEGAMGVPITFFDKYNPDQFDIISANDIKVNENVPSKKHGLIKDKEGAINGKPTYVRIVIQNKKVVKE